MMTRILWLSLPCSSTPSQISTVFLFVLSSTLYMKNISWLNASCLSNLGTDPFKYYSPLKCPAVISAEPITPPLTLTDITEDLYIFYISISIFLFYFYSILFFSFLSLFLSLPLSLFLFFLYFFFFLFDPISIMSASIIYCPIFILIIL